MIVECQVLLKMFGGMLYYYTHDTLYRPAAASHTEMNIALIWHNLQGEGEVRNEGRRILCYVEPDGS